MPLRKYAPPKVSPSKRAFEKNKSRGLFSEFTWTRCNVLMQQIHCVWRLVAFYFFFFLAQEVVETGKQIMVNRLRSICRG